MQKTICIAGKNNIAVNVLNYALDKYSNYDFCIICNKTDNAKDGWQKSLKKYAQVHNVKEVELSDVYDIDNLIFLSLEFDKIVKPELFKSNQLFNIHFSLLPKYKGMYTSALPILNDESCTGVTLHLISRGIDTGDIIAQDTITLEPKDTSQKLYRKYIQKGSELVIKHLDSLISGLYTHFPQPSQGSSYFSKKTIDYTNIVIDLNKTAYQIGLQIRAFSFREYQLPTIYNHKIVDYEITDEPSHKPGDILYQNNYVLKISTIDYNIWLYIDTFDEVMKICHKGDEKHTLNNIPRIDMYFDQRNDVGQTPLLTAIENNQYDIVKYLLDSGASATDIDYEGHDVEFYLSYLKGNGIDISKYESLFL